MEAVLREGLAYIEAQRKLLFASISLPDGSVPDAADAALLAATDALIGRIKAALGEGR